MKKNDFWFVSLIALFIIGVSAYWNIPIRIAVALNSIVVLVDIVKRISGGASDGREKEN